MKYLLPVVAAAYLSGCAKPQGQSAGGPPPGVPVTVATATLEAAPLTVNVVGTVEASSRVEIKSQVAGQLLKVHFTEGQDVKEGQLLLTIDPQPFQEALRQAEAAVERDKALIHQAEAALLKDKVQSQAADDDAARYAALRKDKIASQQQELQYRTAAEAMKETLRSDQAAIASAQSSLKVDEASVSQAKLNLSYTEIHSPIAGRTGNLLVHPGNLVKVNDVPLLVVNRIAPAFVTFNVPEKHLESIRKFSAQGRLPVTVTPRGEANGEKSSGWLSVVDNTVDSQTGTIHLKATFENASAKLWPGQFVDVSLLLESGVSALMVPSEAVQAGQQGPFVYVVKQDKSVEPRPVTVERTVSGKAVLNSGVKAGEVVVTDGQMMLFPGAHVIEAPPEKSASR